MISKICGRSQELDAEECESIGKMGFVYRKKNS
jgi:hypothetical protein